jgi:molybdopterin synthase catalytic subunit
MSVHLHFEEYQKARVKFVKAIAEAATRPQNIEVMHVAGVMQLLRPLLLDTVRDKQRTSTFHEDASGRPMKPFPSSYSM